jgi:hypothetical protein
MSNMEQIRHLEHLEQQIADIETKRDRDLKFRKLMSSSPSMKNSYGNYEQIESSKY